MPIPKSRRPPSTNRPTLRFLLRIYRLPRDQVACDITLAAFDFRYRTVGHEFSLVEDSNPVGHTPGAVHVMCHDDQSSAVLRLPRQQELVDFGCRDAIEAAARFIGKQNPGFEHKSASEARAFSHPAREFR